MRGWRSSIWRPAAQPIHNERRSVWTVFNGEIFNYVELRAELERAGHRFYTRSDTEVIVHLYDRYGDRFVEHLNGQFAIALWDGERRRLLLARDRVGIRPLYHATRRGRLWFGSEIKTLLAALPECASLDPAGLVQTFTFWGPADPQTLFDGVESLPPGHVLTLEADGRRTLRRWWDWDFASAAAPHTSIDAAAEELRALLLDAVRLQLRADVPVGAYLSGGLDSAAIAALIRGYSDTPLRTFSIAFAEREFDEGPEQQVMVRHLGTEHTTLTLGAADIGAVFPELIRHTEAPVLRTAPAPLMLLARAVRAAGYKVVLTGEGADEVFAGYDLFKEAKVRRFWARQPGSTFRPLLLGRLYGYLEQSPVANPAFAQAFFGQGCSTSAGRSSRTCRAGPPPHARSRSSRPSCAHRPRRSIRWRSTKRACRRRRRHGRRSRRTSTSRRNRCCQVICCPRKATASRWQAPSKGACRSSITAWSSSPISFRPRGKFAA